MRLVKRWRHKIGNRRVIVLDTEFKSVEGITRKTAIMQVVFHAQNIVSLLIELVLYVKRF